MLDFDLSETTTLLRDTVARFSRETLVPLSASLDSTNAFPEPIWKALGQIGLLGITVPEAYGGAGMGYLEHVIAMEEISRGSASIGLSYGAHSNLCVNQLYRWGNETQRQRYLPKLISGEWVGALAMSEPNAGSDVMSMQLKADEKTDHFVLNGTKMWITNGPEANCVIVYAKTDPSAGSKGITAFIIERDFQGFSSAQKLDKLGMRGSNTCELVFQNCLVPKENILGKKNEGVKVLMKGLNTERVVLAAGPVGIMQACLDVVLPYIKNRKQFGKAIGEFQLIQAKVAHMYSTLQSCRSYLYTVARACDKDEISNEEAASLILQCSEKATLLALDAIQCLGGNGYTSEYPAGRLLRDAKLYEIGAGTNEIRRLIIGRALFEQTEP